MDGGRETGDVHILGPFRKCLLKMCESEEILMAKYC